MWRFSRRKNHRVPTISNIQHRSNILNISFILTIQCFAEYKPRKSGRCVHEYERSTTFQQQQIVNKYDQYTFLFLFSFIHLLAESVEDFDFLISDFDHDYLYRVKKQQLRGELSLCPLSDAGKQTTNKMSHHLWNWWETFSSHAGTIWGDKICVQSHFTGFQEL